MLEYLQKRLYEYRFPIPMSIVLYPAQEGTLSHAVITELVETLLPEDVEVKYTTDVRGDPSRPYMMVASGNDDIVKARGFLPICRYVGKLSRAIPSDPALALAIEGRLDQLGELEFLSRTHSSPGEFGFPMATDG